jgi:hypothetical protein
MSTDDLSISSSTRVRSWQPSGMSVVHLSRCFSTQRRALHAPFVSLVVKVDGVPVKDLPICVPCYWRRQSHICISKDSHVYCIMMDASDEVNYNKYSRQFVNRKLSTVCTRLLTNLYRNRITRTGKRIVSRPELTHIRDLSDNELYSDPARPAVCVGLNGLFHKIHTAVAHAQGYEWAYIVVYLWKLSIRIRHSI